MALPRLLDRSRLTTLRLPGAPASPLHAAATAGAATPSAGVNLGIQFTMQHQLQEEWCWSAVSVSVALFYSTASQWTQCSLVSNVLGDPTCCTDGSTANCNKPWKLDEGLAQTGNLLTWAEGIVSSDDLQVQLALTRVVACRIGWAGGDAGHFVVISNYREEGALAEIHVKDPLYGDSDYNYVAFQTAYRTNGSWTHSYYTTP